MHRPDEARGAGDVAPEYRVAPLGLGIGAPALDLEQLVHKTGGERRLGDGPGQEAS